MSDFITCENKDLYSCEALIKHTIGQDTNGDFYWKVKAVLGDDYYFFDDFEQAATGSNIDEDNLPDPQSLQDFRWNTSISNFTVLLVEQAEPFFGVMRLISDGPGSGAATWGGSNFNGGWYKSMKTRFQIHTANLATDDFLIGWQGNANDYFYIADNADGNLHIISNNNAVTGDDDTGVAFASDTIYTIELRMEGTTISAILNGVTVPLVNCNVRDLNIFHPIYYYKSNAANNYMDVDYIRLYQERG